MAVSQTQNSGQYLRTTFITSLRFVILNCLNLAQGSKVKAFSGQSHFELITSLTNGGVSVTSAEVTNELGEDVVATADDCEDVSVVTVAVILSVPVVIVAAESGLLDGVPVFAGETVVNDGDFDVMETTAVPVTGMVVVVLFVVLLLVVVLVPVMIVVVVVLVAVFVVVVVDPVVVLTVVSVVDLIVVITVVVLVV